MFKKLTWVYLAIYAAAMLFLSISALIQTDEVGPTQMITSTIMLLLPAVPVALENSGKKVPFIFTLLAFLFTAVMFLGTVKFNNFDLPTLGKAVLFAILLGLLGYFGITRIRKK